MKRMALTLLLALAMAPAAAEIDRALDAQLARLVLMAYDRPEAALSALRELSRQQQPTARAQLAMAEGQILVQGGDTTKARKIVERLASSAQTRDRSVLLSAQLAARDGMNSLATETAQLAMLGLAQQCERGAEAASIARGCDFRTAWAALRIIERDQSAQGAPAEAAATMRHALALAEAGGDSYLSAISMGSLALLSQELDQPDEARRWLTGALERAGDDALAMARTKVTEARIAVRRGDKQGQLRAYEEALDFAQQAESPRLVAQVQTNLTDLHMHNGRPAVALQLARQALPVLLRHKDLRIERTLRHNMAVAMILLRQFDAARRELARAQTLTDGQTEPARRATQLREIGEAWAAAGQPREAIAVFHAERALSALIQARNREAQLQELRLKYDSDRAQRDLDLLTRDKTLKDQQLANRDLAQHVGIAVGTLLALSLLLAGVMLKRVQAANKRLKANQLLLRAQSERDPLTDLANRRHFLAVMAQHAKTSFQGALLMIDIDHFKHVNDRHGHAAGDIVICEVARRISQAVRHEDLVVRWGGEEFLVYAPEVAQDQLQLLAERILFSVCTEPVATEAGPLRVTVSIGHARFPLPPGRLALDWEQAVNWADMALYTAKAQGRNRAVGIAGVEAADVLALQQIEADFDAACSAQKVSLRHIDGPTSPVGPTGR